MTLVRRYLLACVFAVFATTAWAQEQQQPFLLGVDVFMRGHTELLKGHRVGLVTNQTGVDARGVPTIDLLHNHPGINLVALFSPEHGIRGKVAAGERVSDDVDRRTGLRINSLYGANGHRPSPEMLAGVDTLVYDIQDVGSRAYTYIWSLAEVMAACGTLGKTVVVFDRPNPLGGNVVDGPIVEKKWLSFIGLYPIPRVYGMTVGELARYLNAEYDLNCRVVVIPMAGYRRDMSWKDTGLTWLPSSPNIPTPESAVGFAATGTIGTLNGLHIGIGTRWPFQFVGAGWLDAVKSAAVLNRYNLPGVTFVPISFVAESGSQKGKTVNAVFLQVDDPTRFLPTTTETIILDHLTQTYPNNFKWPTDAKVRSGFDKATGTSSLRESLERGVEVQTIRNGWKADIDQFKARRQRYLIYR